MASSLKAPNPALLGAPLPSGDLARQLSASAASTSGAPPHGDEDGDQGAVRLGPITLGTSGMQLLFRTRQKFQLNDKLQASVGAYYNLRDDRVGPTASLTYMLDDRTRIELNERRAFVKRKWAWSRGKLGLGIGAECSVTHTGLPPGTPRRPELHLSLDHIKPLRWELAGIGLVLLGNLPFSLRDKELERPSIASRLLGYTRASVRRTGYAAARVDIAELGGVLEL
ncbi:MAG: hypothetical protein J3K34DRAFT_459042 [Monoraphidium minutum]|nr:MAG: hypothetical protein J3K34DRAFT_459042 [Monoraphidium minutum]